MQSVRATLVNCAALVDDGITIAHAALMHAGMTAHEMRVGMRYEFY